MTEFCPSCGVERSLHAAHQISRWIVGICPACGLGITQPLPTARELSEINEGFYPLDERLRVYESRSGEFRTRWRQLLEYVGLPSDSSSILDVGCNLGFLLDYARRSGFERVAGVELNPACRDWAVRHLRLDVRSSMEAFSGESFALISFIDVLEHTPDPVRLLIQAAGMLRPRGRVLVQLPNRMSDMAHRARDRWSWYSVPDHLYHFTPSSFQRVVERAGLRASQLRTVDVPADYLADRFRWLPGRLAYSLRRVPGTRGAWARRDKRGALIQAVLVSAAS